MSIEEFLKTMKYYKVYVETFHNGKCIDKGLEGKILTEEERETEYHKINWGNLEDEYKRIGLLCHFCVSKHKKGNKVYFYRSSPFNKESWAVKEWEGKELGILVIVHYIEKIPTMDDLRNFDAREVQKYLNSPRSRVKKPNRINFKEGIFKNNENDWRAENQRR